MLVHIHGAQREHEVTRVRDVPAAGLPGHPSSFSTLSHENRRTLEGKRVRDGGGENRT